LCPASARFYEKMADFCGFVVFFLWRIPLFTGVFFSIYNNKNNLLLTIFNKLN